MITQSGLLSKTLVIGIFILLIIMSVVSSTGTVISEKLINTAEQKTKEFSSFGETFLVFNLDSDSFKKIK